MLGDKWVEFQLILIEYFSMERLLDSFLILVRIIIILLVARLLMRFSRFFVDHIFREHHFGHVHYNPKRAQTLKYLTLSSLRYIMYFIAGTMILEAFHFPVASILAGAGIFGLAVGFGAQNLVRDVISGFFILFENQFSVGDHVRIGSIEGIVEEIGIRTTKIKSFEGQVQIIPNGEISIVTNFLATENIRVLFDVAIAYEEDLDRAIAVLEQVCTEFAAENDKIVEGPKVLGVQNFGEYAVLVRVLARTIPMEQWGVERALKFKIKKAFDREGIEFPYPKRVYFFDEIGDKENFRKV